MISFRQADIIDKLQPKVTELHGWAYNRNGKSYSILYFMPDAEPHIVNEVAQVLLGYDDFRRVDISKEFTPLGYGYKSQDMDNGEVVIVNLGEVINGIKQIPGVESVEMNRPTPSFVIRITHR